ncbi:MAG: alpha/beta fold hydrolase [Desulfovibrio sp.]|uniref:alpha/beta hydrolase n=1 Tax=Desulfovibrio sp. TaxID=885 RepID=UPI0039E445F1
MQKANLLLLFILMIFLTNAGANTFAKELKLNNLGAFYQSAASQSAPLILIIPGSGPTDRDGNNPLIGNPSVYRLLAEGLAEEGISSVRIDKRGMFSSAAPGINPNNVSMEDYATDTRDWINFLKKETGQKCIWLLGHSEGGLTALLATRQNSKDVCGLILVATPGKKTSDILRQQLNRNPANTPLLPTALEAIEALEQGKRIDVARLPAPLRPLFATPIQSFLISQMRLDPVELISAHSLPVLIMQGKNDLQVPQENAFRLFQARPDATYCSYLVSRTC